MRTFLLKFFLEHWQRKGLAFFLAVFVWIVLSQMLTVTKVISNIPVYVKNLPHDKTIEGMQINGQLAKKITLNISGLKSDIKDLSAKDLQVIIDARGKSKEWIASIEKKDLVSLNPELHVGKMISRVEPEELIIRQTHLITEKIPVNVTQPIGELPKGYQYLDVWPYKLFVTVKGPEEAVKKLKSRGAKLTLNLSDISAGELDALQQADEMSFPVPDSWKTVLLPSLSDTPVAIDDPRAKALRLKIAKSDLLPIGLSVPVAVFFPPKYSKTLNPETYPIATSPFIGKKHGMKFIEAPLYAQGVSRLFLDTVKDMIEIVIIAAPKAEREALFWNVQFMYPHALEDRYVAKVIAEASEEIQDMQPQLREDYVRNRFRSYMHNFRLYTPQNEKLKLKVDLQGNSISIVPENYAFENPPSKSEGPGARGP